MQITDALMHDIVEWDVATWEKAIRYWDKILDTLPEASLVLDIGARNGGTSLYFALRGLDCVCSDLLGPSKEARMLHESYGIECRIRYEGADCTNLPYPDESFDVVAFKSVMGGVGSHGNDENIRNAFHEIYRVLKPAGVLLFAENMRATYLHSFLRQQLVLWGKRWNYLSLDFMRELLSPFARYDLRTYGFWSCFKKDTAIVAKLDALCCKKPLSSRHYMCYGYAKK